MTGRALSFEAARFRQRAAQLIEESRTASPEMAPQLQRLAAEYEQLAEELDRQAGQESDPG